MAPSGSLTLDLNQAMHDRPEVMQLTQSAAALEGLRAVNFADYLPNVGLFARAGWQESKLQFSSSNDYFTAGVQLHWNLFAGFGTNAHIAENDAQIQELNFQKESLINGIRIELQNARLELQNARERRVIALKQLTSATENERITKLQYDAGVTPLITMIDAQTTLANAQANLTTTTYDVLLADAKYRKALGQH
jgi:outer membrane protein